MITTDKEAMSVTSPDSMTLREERMQNAELIKYTSDSFSNIQRYMLKAREEGATGTYELMKSEYSLLKFQLNNMDANINDIDIIKE